MPAVRGFTRGNLGLFNIPKNSLPGATFEFDPSVAIIMKEFRELGGDVDIRSMRVPLKRAIQEVMAPSFQKNFDVGGRPKWAPLAEFTKKAREEEGYPPGPILVRSGVLRQVAGQLNIWTIDGQQGRAYVSGFPPRAWYGAIHQTGVGGLGGIFEGVGAAKDIPQRAFIVAQKEDIDEVQKVFDEYVQERIRRFRLR